jgi:hypothetical protein
MKSHIYQCSTNGPRPGYDDITDETLTATRRSSSVLMQRRMKEFCA